jgi:deoxyribodipyrimidine photolyase
MILTFLIAAVSARPHPTNTNISSILTPFAPRINVLNTKTLVKESTSNPAHLIEDSSKKISVTSNEFIPNDSAFEAPFCNIGEKRIKAEMTKFTDALEGITALFYFILSSYG